MNVTLRTSSKSGIVGITGLFQEVELGLRHGSRWTLRGYMSSSGDQVDMSSVFKLETLTRGSRLQRIFPNI